MPDDRTGRAARIQGARVSADKPVIDEPPPFLGSWRRVYIMVICYLTGLIALFYLFTRWFAPA